MTTPEMPTYPTDAELFEEVITHKFRNAPGESRVSALRPSEEEIKTFPTTELPGHPYAENVRLYQPRAGVEQPVYTGAHISGPHLTFTEQPFHSSHTTYQTLFHIRNGEIHERVTVDRGLEMPMYDEGPPNDEHLYGRPVDAERASQLIWWLESTVA